MESCAVESCAPESKEPNDYTMKSHEGTIHTLKSSKEERDLGVLIDNELSFKSHIFSKIAISETDYRIIRNSSTSFKHTTPFFIKILVNHGHECRGLPP